MNRSICIIGTGYVGMASMIGLAELGWAVNGYDIMPDRIRKLQAGVAPYREAGIETRFPRHEIRSADPGLSGSPQRCLVGPVLVIIGLLLLPFLSGEGEKSWRRRPIAVPTILLVAVTLGTFTHLAGIAPWSPEMNAWSGDPIPQQFLHGTSALERQGALVFQVKQCRNCHSLGQLGGLRGPALDSVAVRLTQDQLIRQVIQGGGNMPSYGKNLSPAETTALVAFLETLHPQGQTPARNASLSEAQK